MKSSLFELNVYWIQAVLGPNIVVIWIFVMRRLDELFKIIGDHIKITVEAVEKIAKMLRFF
eukprot:3782667-Ditylum_brightwellii.AAC.1